MPEQQWALLAAVALGWLVSVTSGAIFAYIVFRTKREQHEVIFPAKPRKPKHYPIVRDEFAAEVDKDDDDGLPNVIKQMNAKMGAELAMSGLKGERNG